MKTMFMIAWLFWVLTVIAAVGLVVYIIVKTMSEKDDDL